MNGTPRNSRDSRLRAILTDRVKIGLVTRVKVFTFAGTLVIQVQVPSQQPENPNSLCGSRDEIEQNARQFTPAELNHPNPEAASSQQSVSCGRLGAQETGGNLPVRCEAAPKPKLISFGFNQRVWTLIPAKASTNRDC